MRNTPSLSQSRSSRPRAVLMTPSNHLCSQRPCWKQQHQNGRHHSHRCLADVHTAVRTPHSMGQPLACTSALADSSYPSLNSGSLGTNPFDYPEHFQSFAFFLPFHSQDVSDHRPEHISVTATEGCLQCRCAATQGIPARGTPSLPLPVQPFLLRKLQLPEGAGECRAGQAVLGEEVAPPAPQHQPVSLCLQGKEFPLQLGRTRICCR